MKNLLLLVCCCFTLSCFAQKTTIVYMDGVKIQIDTTETGSLIYSSPAEYGYLQVPKLIKLPCFSRFPTIIDCKALAISQKPEYYLLLRKALKEKGFYKGNITNAQEYDRELSAAVDDFKKANGIEWEDGVYRMWYNIDAEVLELLGIQ